MRVYSLRGEKKKELNELKKLADKYPNDMNYRVMMGNWLLQNGKSYEALLEYNKVLKEEPGNLAVRMSLLDYYRSQDKDSIANMMQEQMLVSNDVPFGTKLQLMRNVVQWNEDHGGDSTQVLNIFKRILEQPQEESDMAELMAAYMKLKNMPQDSIDNILEHALRIEPDNASVRMQLLQNAWAAEKTDRIISLSEQGVEYNPEEMVFYYFLALANYQKNERDQALQALRQGAAQINAQTDKDLASEFYGLMGEILHDKGREQEAFAAYDSCLHYKPDNLGTLNNYAYYLSLKRTDLQKAEQMSYRTIKAEPNNATFLDTYAWILFEEERYEEARIYIDQTLMNDSLPSGIVLEHAGDIYAKVNDIEKAMQYWQKAVEATTAKCSYEKSETENTSVKMKNSIKSLQAALLLAAAIALSSCASKKIVTNGDAPLNANTNSNTASHAEVDAKQRALSFARKVAANAVDCQNITSKIEFNLKSGSKDITVSGKLMMRRDDVIRIQLQVPLLGMEAGRLEFTKDYVMIVDRIHSEYVKGDYNQVSFLKNNGLNFNSLQALFWNQLFVPGEQNVTEAMLSNFTVDMGKADKPTLALKRDNMSYLWNTDNNSGRINSVEAEYGTKKTKGNTKLTCTYDDFKTLNGKPFPYSIVLNMNTSATQKARNITMGIQMKKVNNDDDWETRTTLSKKYKQVSVDDVMKKLMNL